MGWENRDSEFINNMPEPPNKWNTFLPTASFCFAAGPVEAAAAPLAGFIIYHPLLSENIIYYDY